MARAPRALAASMASSTAGLDPRDHHIADWLLSLATTQTPPLEPAPQRSLGEGQVDLGPISEAMAPSPTGTALHGLAAQLQEAGGVLQAQASAGRGRMYLAGRWPATKAAPSTATLNSFSSVRITARLTAIRAGWAFSVRVSSILGPFPHQP